MLPADGDPESAKSRHKTNPIDKRYARTFIPIEGALRAPIPIFR
jgi:hypothetical protein